MSSTLDTIRNVVNEMEFAASVRNVLTGVRLIHETDKQTLDRIISLARKVICPACQGYGHTIVQHVCRACDGRGDLADSLAETG